MHGEHGETEWGGAIELLQISFTRKEHTLSLARLLKVKSGFLRFYYDFDNEFNAKIRLPRTR